MKLASSTYYYRRPRGGGESGLQERIVELCAEFSRYGYRRITRQLQAEGMVVNHKVVAA